MYNGIENITICDHPLIKHKLSIVRQRSTGTNEFRTLIEEISMLVGYEALRDLELEEVEIETPIETAMCPMIAGKKPAIVPILRAGLGMCGGMLRLMPAAKVGHIGIYRDEETLEPTNTSASCPPTSNTVPCMWLTPCWQPAALLLKPSTSSSSGAARIFTSCALWLLPKA